MANYCRPVRIPPIMRRFAANFAHFCIIDISSGKFYLSPPTPILHAFSLPRQLIVSRLHNYSWQRQQFANSTHSLFSFSQTCIKKLSFQLEFHQQYILPCWPSRELCPPRNPSNDLPGHLLHSHFSQTLQMRLC